MVGRERLGRHLRSDRSIGRVASGYAAQAGTVPKYIRSDTGPGVRQTFPQRSCREWLLGVAGTGACVAIVSGIAMVCREPLLRYTSSIPGVASLNQEWSVGERLLRYSFNRSSGSCGDECYGLAGTAAEILPAGQMTPSERLAMVCQRTAAEIPVAKL